MENKPVLGTDAETTAREFQEFTYIVSHDLSAPVRAMVEFSKLLKEDHATALSEEGRLYLSLIVEGGEKVQAILASLLDYSRINTTAKPMTPVNCNDMVTHCKELLKDKLKATNANLDVESLPTLVAEAMHLRQVFLALLDNALTFHPANKPPKIKVFAENGEKEWLFTVQDEGIGIEPKFHQRVFQPFQKLHTDKEYPGVGMGLTLAKKIVTRHGGRMWIDPSFGPGTSVVFTIPFQEAR